MLPGRLLHYDLRGDEVSPRFLLAKDHPWLRALLDAYAAAAGGPRRALRSRLHEPLAGDPPLDRLAMAKHVLESLCQARASKPPLPPRRVRAVVFARGAGGGPRGDVLLAAAASLEATVADVERSLLADLADERPVGALPPELSPGALALQVNVALAKGLLARALRVEVRLWGGARPVVRLAKLLGLICTARREPDVTLLEVSGPLALFRRTRVYGRALGALLDPLAWCERFTLSAPCALPEGEFVLRLSPRDPLAPGAEPRRFDSKVEEALARDLARLAPDLDVVREPEPVQVGDSLIFPDLALVHRLDPRRRTLIEIVGFWTPDYLTRKLAMLRRADLPDLILCIDEARACAEGELPEGARVVRYRRRVPAAEVLALARCDAL